MFQILPYMLLSLILGFKHSYDADHLIAVSNFLRMAESLKSATKIGLSWAFGHMLTATIITVLLYLFRESILSVILPHFEKIVGFVLIILGFLSLRELIAVHYHNHRHGDAVHAHPHTHKKNNHVHIHKHIFGIGIVHGLASNDELLILLTSSLGAATLGSILLGLGIFSIGVVLGMLIFSMILSFPLLKMDNKTIYKIFTFGSGAMSIVYGALILI